MKPILHIARMLQEGGRGRHLSFHTPGHKRAGQDITELSYSDSLYSPRGVILRAQEDIAKILGAERSFILTDGSTAGVFSMLYALRTLGCKKIAVPVYSHISVRHALDALSLTGIAIPQTKRAGVPLQPTEEEIARALQNADALLLTSPDYYGFFAPLAAAKALCEAAGKLLVIDGAHGGHLHFTKSYAGLYADLWVDGVHKSLPALTQGAVVSAKSARYAAALEEGVQTFRTTSPSYPIMASVEYAVKYPRNLTLEALALKARREIGGIENDDWTKIVVPFGTECEKAQATLEKQGIYPEFNDGNYLMFYLSPCTKAGELKKLVRSLKRLPRAPISVTEQEISPLTGEEEWVPLERAVGRISYRDAGVFPPCLPLVRAGETFQAETVEILQKANGVFGVENGMVAVQKKDGKV